jgi:maltooligosyltrehalose trehalohydrolase
MDKLLLNRKTLGVTLADGKAQILVWAPDAGVVDLVAGDELSIALEKQQRGYWYGESDMLKAGSRYKFRLDADKQLPDPASVSQPEGVHGPSEVIDIQSFSWTDTNWSNLPLDKYIIYELHTGTFSQKGTFPGIAAYLAHLKELGVNAIEIMPVAQFPGERNWGYDGVFPFAVQHSYGGARGLQELVNTCHEAGIAVILDVVYNHMGPEGNYLGSFGPYFTDKYKTPWGSAINFDDAGCDGVRRYVIENVLMWFRDFHIDALRMDAVHAIKDFSPVHILQEIRNHVDELMELTGRKHYLIVECDLNDTKYINPVDKAGYGMDAQWIDEFHHSLRVASGNERNGYYADFNGIEHLAKAYTNAYVYDGIFSEHRDKTFGIKAEYNPGSQFIVFSQNHDQVGNRMLGERTSGLVSFEMQKLMAAAVVMSPYIPMLFMGEEWGETNPFQYFVSHTDPELAEAVRKGRREEFKEFHAQGEAPDPMSEETFRNSKLQWQLLEKEEHQLIFNYYKELIAIRKLMPSLYTLDRKHVFAEADAEDQTLLLHRSFGDEHVICLMNFSKQQRSMLTLSYDFEWHKVLDSADATWGGANECPQTVRGGEAILVPAESVIIFKN